MCEFAEANSAHIEVTHVSVRSTTKLAATHHTRFELRRTFRLRNH